MTRGIRKHLAWMAFTALTSALGTWHAAALTPAHHGHHHATVCHAGTFYPVHHHCSSWVLQW